jgi:hypothetical protein
VALMAYCIVYDLYGYTQKYLVHLHSRMDMFSILL